MSVKAGSATTKSSRETKPARGKSSTKGKAAKPELPRRGRKRGRCELSYCTDEVCMHCTCDGSCGRGHAPKLCGKRRYEKRANCNQCKVSYYAIAKRKNSESVLENVLPSHIPHPYLNGHNVRPPPMAPIGNPHHYKWNASSYTNSLNENSLPPNSQIGRRQNIENTFPPKPKREELEKWRKFLMEEPPTIVVWDDVKEALEKRRKGETSPMSNSSSEADLSSLASNESALQPKKDLADNNTLGESKMFDCSELKDPDFAQSSFSSIDDEEGLFNCLLDDMETGEEQWGNFGGKDLSLKTEDVFTDAF